MNSHSICLSGIIRKIITSGIKQNEIGGVKHVHHLILTGGITGCGDWQEEGLAALFHRFRVPKVRTLNMLHQIVFLFVRV
jgi:hypothetical protein